MTQHWLVVFFLLLTPAEPAGLILQEIRMTPSTTLRGRVFGLSPRQWPQIEERKGPDVLSGEIVLDLDFAEAEEEP